jgi:CarD family transcriptional regulator
MNAARKVATPAHSAKATSAKASPAADAAVKKPVAAKAAAVSHAGASKTAAPAPQKAAMSAGAVKPPARPPTSKAAATAQATKTGAVPPPAATTADAGTADAVHADAAHADAAPANAAPANAAHTDAAPANAAPKASTATDAAPAPAASPAAPAAAPAPRPAAAPPAPAAPERRMGPMDRIPPRQPSKAETFIEGDHVVYPTHGVGKVERIATEEIAGHKLELIHITFEENRMTLRVPVSKARSAGLRKLASRKLFDEAMGVLKGRARIKRTMWSRRAQEYEAKINSGDPLAIAEVVRDLHRNAGQPDQSFSERQIYEAAMDRLAAELAALDKTDKTTAVTKLVDFLKTVA